MGEAKRKTARGPVPTLEQYLRALGSDRAEERDAFADLADFVSRTLEAYEQTDENRQIAQMQRCMKIAALAMVEGCNDEVRHGHAPATAAVAMCRAFGIPFKEVLDEFVPTGIYTLPEVSMVGLTEAAARELSDDVGTGRTWFSGNARARISGSTEGMLKLVFRASDRTLLGAHILGEEATELIHVAQAVLHRGGAIDEFIDTTFNFPTRADAYKYAAYDGLPPRASTLHHESG